MCFGGGGRLCFRGVSVVMMKCALWYVILCGWLRGEMQYSVVGCEAT